MPGSGADIHRDGTTHVLFEPLDFLARLAALVPPPRLHLTRYHGVFAAHRRYGAEITPAGRCGARLKVIASIKPPELIERILAHLHRSASPSAAPCSPRAPPQTTPPL